MTTEKQHLTHFQLELNGINYLLQNEGVMSHMMIHDTRKTRQKMSFTSTYLNKKTLQRIMSGRPLLKGRCC